MTWYLIRRPGQSIAVVIGVMILTFVLLHLEPGSVARSVLGLKATPARVAIFDSLYGLNKPLYQQFGIYVKQIFQGNLGRLLPAPAAGDLADRAAAAPGRDPARPVHAAGPGDRRAHRDLPGGAAQPPGRRPARRDLVHAVFGAGLHGGAAAHRAALRAAPRPAAGLPGTRSAGCSRTAGAGPAGRGAGHDSVAGFSQYVRSTALQALAEDYIRVVRAKGLPERLVLTRHVLRNSLLPVITILGLSFLTSWPAR